MSMELKILTSEDKFLKAIEFNFDELKTALGTELEKYKGLTYTSATLREAKADKATLNKFKEAIDTKRKELKKRCLAPYEEFESKIKILIGMVDEQASAIDTQVKTFEDKAKAQKRELLQARWADLAVVIGKEIPFEKIFDPRWLNVSYNLNTAYTDMEKKYDEITQAIDCINSQAGEYVTPVTQKYYETLSLPEALHYRETLANMDKAKTNTTAEVATISPYKKTVVDNTLRSYDFRVWLTTKQKESLVNFLKTNGIKYGKVN